MSYEQDRSYIYRKLRELEQLIGTIVSGSGTPVRNETLSGTVDGVNTVFTTSFNFISGSTAIYHNGMRQQLGDDYTETGPNEITFSYAPKGPKVYGDYSV